MAAAGAGGGGGQEKLYSISVLKWKDTDEPMFLSTAVDVSSFGFFQRSSVQEFLMFISRTVASPTRTQPGIRQQIEEKEQRIYVHSKTDGLACVVACNEHYPSQTAFMICSKTLMEFSERFAGKWEDKKNADNCCDWPELTQRLAKYQKPEEADKILRIQKDLEEVKTIMQQNMKKLCERGEKIEDLVQQSEDLTGASKTFYKSAASQNACCCMM